MLQRELCCSENGFLSNSPTNKKMVFIHTKARAFHLLLLIFYSFQWRLYNITRWRHYVNSFFFFFGLVYYCCHGIILWTTDYEMPTIYFIMTKWPSSTSHSTSIFFYIAYETALEQCRYFTRRLYFYIFLRLSYNFFGKILWRSSKNWNSRYKII